MLCSIHRNIIEDGISSQENQNECHLPDLPLDSPEMMAFLKNEPPIQCDDVEAWVSCGTDLKVMVLLSILCNNFILFSNQMKNLLADYRRCHGCVG